MILLLSSSMESTLNISKHQHQDNQLIRRYQKFIKWRNSKKISCKFRSLSQQRMILQQRVDFHKLFLLKHLSLKQCHSQNPRKQKWNKIKLVLQYLMNCLVISLLHQLKQNSQLSNRLTMLVLLIDRRKVQTHFIMSQINKGKTF